MVTQRLDQETEVSPNGMTRRLFSLMATPGVTAVVVAGLLAGCATERPAGNGSQIAVVAAENVWGSIAAQLGGERVSVKSIIASPDADPHDYEPTAADARALASAQYVVSNGAGYDPWVAKLIAANPAPGRPVLNVGQLVGVKEGGNPHRWYSPDDVHHVIEQISADYKRIDPAHSAYFDQRKQNYQTHGLARYNQLITDIKSKYRGTSIGASESIVTPLAEDLGLRMATPESFLDACRGESPRRTARQPARQGKAPPVPVQAQSHDVTSPDPQRRVEATALRQVTDPLVGPAGRLAQYLYSARRQRQGSENDLKQGGLADSVGAQHRDELAGRDRQVESAPQPPVSAIHRAVAQGDHRLSIRGRLGDLAELGVHVGVQ